MATRRKYIEDLGKSVASILLPANDLLGPVTVTAQNSKLGLNRKQRAYYREET